MELRHLNAFKVVAEIKSFTRAAEQLGYAQSSVTAQIQALEEELGVQLFNRLGKKIIITEAGERLFPYVVEVQKLLEQATSAVVEGDIPQGTLTIGAPESLCAYRLPSLLQECRRLYPQVKLVLRPGVCWQLRQQVRSGELDLAFLLDERSESPDLILESLLPEQIVFVAAPSHPLAKLPSVSPHDLKQETVLLTETGCSYRTLFEQDLNSHNIYLNQQLEFGSLEAIKQCVITGLGVANVPEMVVAQELAAGKLVALNWTGAPYTVETQLLYHKDKWIPPAMKEFLNLTRTFFRQLSPTR